MSFYPSLTHNAGVRQILIFNTKVGRAFVAFSSAAFQNADSQQPAHEDLSTGLVSGLKGNPGLFNTRGQALCDADHEPLMALLDATATLELRA